MTKLTPQELDERINELSEFQTMTSVEVKELSPRERAAIARSHDKLRVKAVKQLIRDCIEAVTPERITGRDLIAVKGSPDFTRHAAVSNIILDLVEQETKELLG